MIEPKRNRGPRRALLVALPITAAVALGAGGAGVAHASSNDAGPVETGYVVVGTSEGTGTASTDRECEEQRGGGGGQAPSPSAPAPSAPATPDAEGRL